MGVADDAAPSPPTRRLFPGGPLLPELCKNLLYSRIICIYALKLVPNNLVYLFISFSFEFAYEEYFGLCTYSLASSVCACV